MFLNKALLDSIYKTLTPAWPFFITFLFFSEIGESLWRTNGHYHARRFVYLLLSACAFYFISFKKIQVKQPLGRILPSTLLTIISYFLYKQFLSPKIGYPLHSEVISFIKYGSLLFCLGSLLTLLKPQLTKPLILSLLLFFFISKGLVLYTSPSPHIDVFTSNTQAAQWLWSGVNPYNASYHDIYAGEYDYPPGYPYFPLVLILQSLSYKFTGDIRTIHILFDFLGLMGLYWLLKQYHFNFKIRLLFLGLWFSYPTYNFILEQSWVDVLTFPFNVFLFYFFSRKEWLKAGVCLGLLCSLRQYAAPIAILIGLFFLVKKQIKPLFKVVFSSTLTLSIISLPFAFWSWSAFLERAIKVPLAQDFRADSFSLVAILINQGIISPTSWVFSLPPMLVIISSALYFRRNNQTKDLILFASFVYCAIFFFGKQAFCNYYYFLATFVFLYLIHYTKDIKDIRENSIEKNSSH